MGGAYDELRATGGVGESTLALIRDLAGQVTRTSSFPPPEGYDAWSPEAVDDLLAELFAAKGSGFVLTCFLEATDDGSLERLLLRTIRNFLIDEAKKTERGKLRRRLEGLLEDDPRFACVPEGQPGAGGWCLAGQSNAPWQGDSAQLDLAAAAVRGVAISRWNTAGPTPRPVKQALLRVAEGVLRAAGGSVSMAVLTRVVEARIALIAPLLVGGVADDQAGMDLLEAQTDPPGFEMIVRETAQEIYRVLDARERALLPHLGAPLDDQMQVLELGRAQTRLVADRLAEKIRLMTTADEDRDDIVLELLRLCVVRP
ncbi:MAG TPA: hypothetical protein VGS97_17095 [Actinocrinis sp.]|uniref:hypothetical protein n=1 Tax=Actinocrinis sp. TaxID=1920516 RepID=UPI002DDCD9B9|nr:hypothetical protein [Actinocrinis sp.]HEV2345819.1 hypothetical protein [Actinocrinis sp.]